MTRLSTIPLIIFFTPLLIANVQYLDFLITSYDKPYFIYYFNPLIPYLSSLLSLDLIAATFYLWRKSYPYSIFIFALLILCNLLIFLCILYSIDSPYVGIALVGMLPYFITLLVIDIIAVLIRAYPHGGKARNISYVFLTAVSSALSIGYLFY